MPPVLRAFLVAPLAAPTLYWIIAFIGAVVDPDRRGQALRSPFSGIALIYVFGGLISYAITVTAGVPVYLLLRRGGILGPESLVGAGVCIGVVTALAVLFSALSYIAAAMSLLGFVPERVSFWRTVVAQVAGSFVKIVAPAAGGYRFPWRAADEGLVVPIGDLSLVAMATPGHTPEHLAWQVVSRGSAAPTAVLTGGPGARRPRSGPPGWRRSP